MQETLRCPGCQAELTLAMAGAASAQCPRCRCVVDLVRPSAATALTAEAPLPTVRHAGVKPNLDDDLPDDLRTLVRPDPLTGEWKAVVAQFALSLSVLSYGVQTYLSVERVLVLRQQVQQRLFADAAVPFPSDAAILHEAIFWPALVCVLLWLYQASANLKLLRAAALSHTPGLAVVSFFVPFMNLYRPYYIVQEIWRGSDPRAVGNSLAWLDTDPSEPIRCWWFCFLAAHMIALASRRFEQSPSWQTQGTAALLACVSHLSMMIAGVLLIAIIHAITTRQRQRYDGLYAAPA